MKDILVVGGSYFAGRVLVERLAGIQKYGVCVFNRGNLPIAMDNIRQLTGDREISGHIANNIPRRHWNAVVDFCAYTPEHIDSLLANFPGTIGHYIFISTTSVYAPTKHVPVPEHAAKVAGPQPELGEFADYGNQKRLAEYTLEKECSRRSIPFTILRPAIIYGRYNYAPRESFFFNHAIAAKPLVVPENPHVFYSFVWVEDMADIIIACLENPAVFGNAYNVASEEMISYNIMADIVEEVSGHAMARIPMSTRDIIRRNIPMPFPPDEHLLYDGRKLQQVLNYVHTPFILGIARTWADYQAVLRRRRDG